MPWFLPGARTARYPETPRKKVTDRKGEEEGNQMASHLETSSRAPLGVMLTSKEQCGLVVKTLLGQP